MEATKPSEAALIAALKCVAEPVLFLCSGRATFVNDAFISRVFCRGSCLGSAVLTFLDAVNADAFLACAGRCLASSQPQTEVFEIQLIVSSECRHGTADVEFIPSSSEVVCIFRKLTAFENLSCTPIASMSLSEHDFNGTLEPHEVAQLREEAQWLKCLFRAAPVGLAVVSSEADSVTRMLLANEANARVWKNSKASSADSPGTYMQTFLAAAFAESRHTGEPVAAAGYHAGLGKHLETHVASLGGDCFAVVTEDHTPRKELEETLGQHQEQLEGVIEARTAELHNALEVKGRFLSVMSHEMRTPLGGIMSNLLLLDSSNFSEELKDVCSIALACCRQLEVMICDLLDYSKMEEDNLVLEVAPFQLLTAVDEALEIVAGHAESARIELICDVRPPFPALVRGDSARVRQILVNLLGNAIKFSHPNGEVVLTASAEEFAHHWHIFFNVQDWGVGIPEECKPYLFQPFSPVEVPDASGLNRRHGGAGLGLTICKRLVGLMQGDISYESKEGEGSSFSFRIQADKPGPLDVDLLSPRRLSFNTSPSSMHTSQLRILIIDEHPNFRSILRRHVCPFDLLSRSVFSDLSCCSVVVLLHLCVCLVCSQPRCVVGIGCLVPVPTHDAVLPVLRRCRWRARCVCVCVCVWLLRRRLLSDTLCSCAGCERCSMLPPA
eukprot:TRINITY_DN4951_c0_g1_i1.p1 TRINITY_DN4951_c0_g1~~TRINITY_DN4951_c0_g1_i1.p1  ORF type:complete len:668 (+),score=110.30 TRINITY_DN4951_c0_g1_i1:85-2088(+)